MDFPPFPNLEKSRDMKSAGESATTMSVLASSSSLSFACLMFEGRPVILSTRSRSDCSWSLLGADWGGCLFAVLTGNLLDTSSFTDAMPASSFFQFLLDG